MSDALVSPAVGGVMWAATAGLTAVAARRVERDGEEGRVALMGVLGAFVFAAQMVNFAIPATGSSGHLGGGLLLAILLGPHAAFVVMASVLAVQALFFADGGLLAFGCNVWNLGFFTCFLAYPLVWRPLAGASPTRGRVVLASLAAAVVALQLGALGVVLETVASGISTLPFAAFAALMQPVHLAIGLVEGLVTAALVGAVWRARPDVLAARGAPARLRPLLAGLALAAAATGGVGAWFASSRPDGLEWAVARLTGGPAAAAPADALHALLARASRATAIMPGYRFRGAAELPGAVPAWPEPRAATTLSGLLGGVLVLATALAAGAGLRALRRSPRRGR
ncbi:MAG: energy-coupling factor ABC transporter permease [Anaeromyxobacteraceae bacterium]